jgi:CheY-like chemotaxis protein
MRILYVEDEPADAQLVARYVQSTEHELVTASTIQEAKDSMDSEPGLILVDILLNRTRQGYDFVSELRAQGYTAPIIAVTGLALPLEIEHCYRVGFTDVLTKPYAVRQLADLLQKYL